MRGDVINCRLSRREISELDRLVDEGYFRNRSDAIRNCLKEYLFRLKYE